MTKKESIEFNVFGPERSKKNSTKKQIIEIRSSDWRPNADWRPKNLIRS